MFSAASVTGGVSAAVRVTAAETTSATAKTFRSVAASKVHAAGVAAAEALLRAACAKQMASAGTLRLRIRVPEVMAAEVSGVTVVAEVASLKILRRRAVPWPRPLRATAIRIGSEGSRVSGVVHRPETGVAYETISAPGTLKAAKPAVRPISPVLRMHSVLAAEGVPSRVVSAP